MWCNRRRTFIRPLFKTNAYRFIFKVKPLLSLSGRLGGTKSWTEHSGSEQRALSLRDHLIFVQLCCGDTAHIVSAGSLSDCNEEFGLQLRKLEIPIVISPHIELCELEFNTVPLR
jgi:hypothetical protein